MKIYTASRLTDSNRVFPSKIIIGVNTVTVSEPSLLGGKEKTIPFSKIASVDIKTPFVGFSTITINTIGEDNITKSGFKKDEVIEMKKIILDNI